MSNTETGAVPRARTSEGGPATSLVTDKGTTSINDGVVAKIAGLAAREVSGVHAMGAGTARALGSMKGIVGGDASVSQGVSVEVGERQAAVDMDLVAEYGTAIPDLAAAVRRNVIAAIERMCGLEVTEVNIRVDDVHLPGQERGKDRDTGEQRDAEQEPRVQ
ncbi:Asp23/Gls24 family envelope stress response protein [Nonomuraea sp. KC401]|uniref:Asp23/Gls24 family envelope stress response protein n=1 Tax=unclassified Nonomuraea TaxID=2593643 RepID=UPI0010FF0895|nr:MULTISPECIES: Asp23/Gls24 family envelope stress response protein [unclassified Nonomuraea]NBE96101.1 Asp23/Gls24 family envelope stress response protein [Nonomuraea sp. K271]TLF80298.1 Asp23/Gls24 family envelope stress response protein [Nonomuraea sp. KC401]